jgi:hypothetical protein
VVALVRPWLHDGWVAERRRERFRVGGDACLLIAGQGNAVGAAAGALGALAASLAGLGHRAGGSVQAWLFAVLIPIGLIGAVLAVRLSGQVEAATAEGADRRTPLEAVRGRSGLGPSRRTVHRLSALFALDAAGGGLVTTAFLPTTSRPDSA